MTRLKFVSIIILCSVVAASLMIGPKLCFCAQQAVKEDRGFSISDKVVIAYYYIWFTKGWFNRTEGNAGAAMDDINPIVGSYDSWDSHVIEEHVKMAKRTRIDAFAVSWWFDDSRKGMNDRLAMVFEKARKYGLKIAINLETDKRKKDKITQALEYYLEKYSNDPAVLKVDGIPVVMIWGVSKFSNRRWSNIFKQLQEEGLNAFYIPSWSTDPKYLGPFRALEIYSLVDIKDDELAGYFKKQRKEVDVYNRDNPDTPAQWHATIMPGYDETKIPGRKEGPCGAGWKDRDSGRYYRRTFEAAMASNPDWIRISTFNELAEHSHIEPMEEFGYLYIDMTAEFVEKFKKQ